MRKLIVAGIASLDGNCDGPDGNFMGMPLDPTRGCGSGVLGATTIQPPFATMQLRIGAEHVNHISNHMVAH